MMRDPDKYELDQIKAIGQYFADERRSQGLTQYDMIERLGTSQAQISKFENGLSTFRFTTLQRWARALGYRVELTLVSMDEIEQQKFNDQLQAMMNEIEKESQQ